MIQSRHYAPNTRAEALQGLGELAVHHPSLVATHLRTFVLAAAERFGDTEEGPRGATLALLRTLVAAVPAEALAPFAPYFVAHLGSALTSLERAVRVDALLLLPVLLDGPRGAALVAATPHADWLAALLPSLTSILRVTGTGLRGSGAAKLGSAGVGIGAGAGPSSSKGKGAKKPKVSARVKSLQAILALLSATGAYDATASASASASSEAVPTEPALQAAASAQPVGTAALALRRMAPPLLPSVTSMHAELASYPTAR